MRPYESVNGPFSTVPGHPSGPRVHQVLALYITLEMGKMSGMRVGVLVFCIVSLWTAGLLKAQDQEAEIATKLQTRNVNVAPTLFQNKAFYDGSTFNGTRDANTSSFYFIDHVRTKNFIARTFYGSSDYWAGHFKFNADKANLNTRNVVVNATKQVETKTSATKADRDSNKESATRDYASGSREFRGRGRSQDRLDKEGEKALMGTVPLGLGGDLHQLTIDEVRQLLNKNK